MACHGGPDIVEDNLVLCLDAGNTKSYPGTGTAWNDVSGDGNNSTVDGATFNTNLFDFDGTNGNVQIPNITVDDSLFSGTNNFTVEFWFNADDLPANGGTDWQYSQVLLGGGTHNLYVNFGDSLDDKEVGVRIQDGDGGSWISPVGSGADTINNNTWYNVIVTYNSSSGWVLYLNGDQKETSATVGDFGGTFNDENNRLIGCLRDNTSSSSYQNRFFDGKISICRIYDTVLTAAEVKQNFDAQKGRFGL